MNQHHGHCHDNQGQLIRCNVNSCVHNTHSNICSLDCIQVSPCPGGANGDPKDESMCASYSIR